MHPLMHNLITRNNPSVRSQVFGNYFPASVKFHFRHANILPQVLLFYSAINAAIVNIRILNKWKHENFFIFFQFCNFKKQIIVLKKVSKVPDKKRITAYMHIKMHMFTCSPVLPALLCHLLYWSYIYTLTVAPKQDHLISCKLLGTGNLAWYWFYRTCTKEP